MNKLLNSLRNDAAEQVIGADVRSLFVAIYCFLPLYFYVSLQIVYQHLLFSRM